MHERQREPWFDADGFLLHDGDDGGIAGFCWTKVHPADRGRPGARRDLRDRRRPRRSGTGLGRALTVAGLEHLAGLGIDTGMLYVEADNDAAVSLYERLGFEVHHSDAAYDARRRHVTDPLGRRDSS